LSARTAPTSTLPTTGFLYAQDYQGVKFFFGAKGAANASAQYQIYAYHPITVSGGGNSSGNTMFLPELVAKGVFLAGANTFGTSAAVFGLVADSANLIADVITDTAGLSGTIVQSATNGVNAFLSIPMRGAAGLVVDTRCANAGRVSASYCFAKLR
jgi:hypothetical protein